MVNLIDRAGLLNQLCEKCGGGCDDDKEKRCWKYKLIMEQSTIEPEVRHGRWKKKNGEIYCTNCKKSKWSESFKLMLRGFDFCPNCGARMDATDTNVGGKGGADNGAA